MLVQARQRILRYLRKEDANRYAECIRDLGLDDHAVTCEFKIFKDNTW
jgi:ribosomal protein S15P/S13E